MGTAAARSRMTREALAAYRAKRDFARTPEPAGEAPPAAGENRFVVQRHRASRLHYDLRFEIDGVLVSWAVPKGPTLDPGVKRLAVHVEDHPVEYFDFEGVIPAGEYGGGDVIVWDWGTWDLRGAGGPGAAVQVGDLHVELHGQKLNGSVALVRRGRDRSGKEQWLLIHKHDEFAESGWDAEDHPRSVKSGRTNDQVARDGARTDSPVTPEWPSITEDELAALDDLGEHGVWELQGRQLQLTDLDRRLIPGRDDRPPVTKRELIRYYATIAPVVLPYLHNRPVNPGRPPDRTDSMRPRPPAIPEPAPDWIRRWRDPGADPGDAEWHVVADTPATLAWLVNDGVIELHGWTSTTATPDEPTHAVIDIDPGESTTFDDVLTLATLCRTALDHLGVRGWPKLSGHGGIQIWVPVDGGATFDDTGSWVAAISRAVGETVPELVNREAHIEQHRARARLDRGERATARTSIAPYSACAAAGATVSAPISWDEVDDADVRQDGWTVTTVFDRLRDHGDLFLPVLTERQRLPTLRDA